MSVMGPDGKILQPGGGWWSPYGDTDEEIQKNMAFRVNENIEYSMKKNAVNYCLKYYQNIIKNIKILKRNKRKQ